MYDREVDVPRLLRFYGAEEPLPHPTLTAAREALTAHYARRARRAVRTAGMCLYRDGRDRVAWHGDTNGRGRARTRWSRSSRSVRRGRSCSARAAAATIIRHRLGHGDLIVMGGSCQRTWEHAVPKTTRAVGPRISVQFRPRGVR